MKRILDLVVALAATILLFPVLVAIAIVVRLTMGNPVLFRQKRPGHNGSIFTLYKFRTMVDAVDRYGTVLPDGERLTRVGQFLRRSSLDELPQLWNVLSGDMSLVGPRPLLPEYLPRYTQQQRRRLDVLPGLTGWAQVMGRNTLTWHQKFELDIWYVEHQSLWLDLRILVLTFRLLILHQGINHNGHDTMPEFIGSSAGHER